MSSRVLGIGDQIDAIARTATREELVSLLAMLEGRRVVVRERLRVVRETVDAGPKRDRAITAAEAAKIADGYSAGWFYDHAHELEFTINSPGRPVRFSEVGLRAWVARWMTPKRG